MHPTGGPQCRYHINIKRFLIGRRLHSDNSHLARRCIYTHQSYYEIQLFFGLRVFSDSAIRRQSWTRYLCGGRMDSLRTTLSVKKSTVKEGTVAMGEKVKVAWGKTKKLYNAEVLSISSTPPAPATPRASATEEEPFTFELAAAAPCTPTPQPTPSADRQDQKFLRTSRTQSQG